MDLFVQDDRPSFFQFLYGGYNTNYMKIPPKFVRKYNLSEEIRSSGNIAVLKGSSGELWNIASCKKGKGLFLMDGWEKFLEDNSLRGNEFLVFTYDGNMHFDVQIFDKSGLERLSAISLSKRPRGRPRVFPQKIKGGKEVEKEIRIEELDLTANTSKAKTKSADKRSKGKEKLEEKVGNFTSNFPFFKSCLPESSVKKAFLLAIPRWFAKAHLPQCTTFITLRTSDGKSWQVKSVFWKNATITLSKGWSNFVLDNKLQKNDVCIFVLVAPKELLVHFFDNHRKLK
ncbi:hypothetical protein SLE2022_044630 [Rubroshorea leprosula]